MTDLGASWIVISGNASIVNGEAVLDAGALVLALPHADRGAQKVIVQMMDLQPYKTYRIVIDSNLAGTSYDYVEYECTSTPAGSDYVAYLKVGNSGTGDADLIEDQYTAGDDVYLGACRTPGGLYGTAENSEIVAWTCASEPSDLYAGLENASISLDIEFDNFQILKYEGTNSAQFPGDPDTTHRCYYCNCECDGYCLPETLNMNITGSGLSSCLSYDIPLTYEPGHDPFQWYGTDDIKEPTCPAFDTTAQFLLMCNGDQDFSLRTDWSLIVPTGWGTCIQPGWVNCHSAAPSTIQCDPLELVFGPFTETVSGNTGTYWITITE